VADKARAVTVAAEPAAKPTELPTKYERLFAWQLDRRCSTVRAIRHRRSQSDRRTNQTR
jgi:hypothetical protein